MANDQQDSANEARSWVQANRQLVDEAYQRFLHHGERSLMGPEH